jgi:hypothetical protein
MSEFPNKLLKLLGDFPSKAESMSAEDLKKELVKCERVISQFEADKKADVKLVSLKDDYKEAASIYDDAIKENRAYIKYIVHVLDDRGVV